MFGQDWIDLLLGWSFGVVLLSGELCSKGHMEQCCRKGSDCRSCLEVRRSVGCRRRVWRKYRQKSISEPILLTLAEVMAAFFTASLSKGRCN